MKAKSLAAAAFAVVTAAALVSSPAADANPNMAIGCSAGLVRAGAANGAYYTVTVTNTSPGTMPAGAVVAWSLQSDSGNRSGQQILSAALAPRASTVIADAAYKHPVVSPGATCTASTAQTGYSGPGYGSGSGGPVDSNPSHGRPPMRPQ